MRRVFDRLLRHVVRWLRRHRYARTAGRIRELEIELGMVEPTFVERYANPALIGSRKERRESWHARLEQATSAYVEALGAVGVTQHATDHSRNFFANSEPMAELIKLYKTLIDLRPELPRTGSHALDGWTRCGFDPEQAATWYQAGFTPWHARDYRDQYGRLSCIPASERVRWARHAIEIAERLEHLTPRSSA